MDHQQEGGWPLGLQPLNLRIGLASRDFELSGSLNSFSSLTTASPTSSSTSSSDLDAESARSFFGDRSITLGSLIGITGSILDLSSRQQRNSRALLKKKSHRAINKANWFSLCSAKAQQLSGEMAGGEAAPSLGHFLEAERRASVAHPARRSGVSVTYELQGLMRDELSQPATAAAAAAAAENHSLFSNGLVLPPHRLPPPGDESKSLVCVGHVKKAATKPGLWSDHGGILHGFWDLGNVHCTALMFPCTSAQATE
ncbi:hypothetical protein Cni_G15665 [Canna indica]|uniref:Uncharacterized protein n=1 Tax=Canna indica TaxID=4628 RepID=A0AAQ3QG04_9LILI|nr:hypothetical protein Cni_G15665 [Canna indica]